MFFLPSSSVRVKAVNLPFPRQLLFPFEMSLLSEITYRIRGRQQAPLDESFKRSLQNKVLLGDGLLGDLLCWQCLHMLSNRGQVRLFQVTVPTGFQLTEWHYCLAWHSSYFFPVGVWRWR